MVSQEEGPDGSPIKSVSSLRSQFENMNKSHDANHGSPRPISPAPKPDRLRESKTGGSEAIRVPNSHTRPKPAISTLNLLSAKEPALLSPARSLLPAPPLSPRPLKPPSVTIQPPQSPPKGRITNLVTADQPAYLNPDSIVTPTTPSSSSRSFKIPSRPHTPMVEPRKSPRIPGSNPPSPPPPRRSGEIRRETKPTPPPINRAEKPATQSRLSYFSDFIRDPNGRKSMKQESSPFSSPPSSGGSTSDDTPPPPPTRPRPQMETAGRQRTLQLTFEPPPLHHSIASIRRERDQESNGHSKGTVIPQITSEQRPSLPSRTHMLAEPPLRPSAAAAAMGPPPRPPRPGITTSMSVFDDSSQLKSKRVAPPPSTPVAPHSQTQGQGRGGEGKSDQPLLDYRTNPLPLTRPLTSDPQDDPNSQAKIESSGQVTNYPDTSSTNRRPPYFKQGAHEIYTRFDARVFDVCGEYICCVGHMTKVWNLLDGELIMSLAHGEGMKATAVRFKPAPNPEQEGSRVWIGTNLGELLEVDVASQGVIYNKPTAHSPYDVVQIHRHHNELWTLDEGGTLHIWGSDEDGAPSLDSHPHRSYRLPKGHTHSLVAGNHLWHAVGREIRVFAPSSDGSAQFQVTSRPLVQDSAGDVTSGTVLRSVPDRVFFGHVDGKVSIYSTVSPTCVGLLSISTYKINSLAGAGRYIWAGYNPGRVCVYDMASTPWTVKKDWQAHEGGPVIKLIADPASAYRLDRLQVISLGADNMVKIWDGLLQEDWLEREIKARDGQYCEFEQIKALVMTWNAGASTPHSLRYSDSDATFMQSLLRSSECPDVLVFGFQELVDLEDKTATAKRLFKAKKKDKKEGSEQERMSHQYRDWRDFLIKTLDDNMPPENLYHLLQTATLVGLFTCIFVRSTLRERIGNLSIAQVKRGMGGYHGNKGAIVVRFTVDDTSLCFINCHLAAGQSQANSRHNDISAILEGPIFPVERDPICRIDSYVGGGDGSMILDHELCVLNGDLNYRIDTMSRDTVVMAVRANNLSKLLERDQLLVARRRNPTFRLRAFEEMPITFAPTYKYDVGTDNYDTSEKKRSPAWCDRLLFRGHGRVQQLDYKRHEVRVSDHRPVSGQFLFTVKTIDPHRRDQVWMDCQRQFEEVREKERDEERLFYLSTVCGYDTGTSRSLVREKAARRDRSRQRE